MYSVQEILGAHLRDQRPSERSCMMRRIVASEVTNDRRQKKNASDFNDPEIKTYVPD